MSSNPTPFRAHMYFLFNTSPFSNKSLFQRSISITRILVASEPQSRYESVLCLLQTMGESPGKMYALATVLTVLAMVAVTLRLYARRITKQRLEWDDCMIFLALVSGTAAGLLRCQNAQIRSSSSLLGRRCACSLVSLRRCFWDDRLIHLKQDPL